MVAQFRDTHAGVWVGDDDPVTVTEDGRVVRPMAVAPAPHRRMPVRTATVELDGEYEGWRATVRTNGPFGMFLKLSQFQAEDDTAVAQAMGGLLKMLPQMIFGWNFVDVHGDPLPCNAEGFDQLPGDLLMALVGAMNRAGAAEGAVPKE